MVLQIGGLLSIKTFFFEIRLLNLKSDTKDWLKFLYDFSKFFFGDE